MSRLNDEFSSLPEVDLRSAKIQADRDDQWKEVAGADGLESAGDFAPKYSVSPVVQPALLDDSSEIRHDTPSKARLPLKRILTAVALIVVLGIALGVGLGLGLRGGRPSQTASSRANLATAKPLSTRGAFNGSGFAIMSQSTLSNFTSGQTMAEPESQSNLLLFFQHHTGEIRWMSRPSAEPWRGGSVSEIVATNAKNGTPISALAPTEKGGAHEWHVFYIGEDNLLKQRSITNTTYTWTDGLINQLNIEVLDAERVGLQACFYDGPVGSTGQGSWGGIRLWVASSETTFDQWVWNIGLSHWIWEQSWQELNGAASPACYGWAPDAVDYIMFLDLNNAISIYWEDISTQQISTATHPINKWTKCKRSSRNRLRDQLAGLSEADRILASIEIPNVDPATGLGWHALMYAKPADSGLIRNWNVSFAAENTSISSSTASAVEGGLAASGTHLGVWSLPPGLVKQAEEALVFYQTEGDDITLFSQNLISGVWNTTRLPIPDE
ncbi:hypothetical protein LTR37_018038 [Vermiconidia calcicola]|uniref:Uncharacterized protein n=1 Tax=Vermiconidia calcicola TaxID=1690605 RepID=A0ACC3MIC2_9PEZI|nr:hypothetical protein LTR37_018038 [Vermiconidia calcicola]